MQQSLFMMGVRPAHINMVVARRAFSLPIQRDRDIIGDERGEKNAVEKKARGNNEGEEARKKSEGVGERVKAIRDTGYSP